MSETKKVIEDLCIAKCMLASPQMLNCRMNIRIGQAISAAIALLKAQEPKTAISNPEKYGDYLRHCPSCEAALPLSSQYGRAKFCHLCGQAVKWE